MTSTEYYQKNRERLNQLQRIRALRNPEKQKKYFALYYLRHHAQFIERGRQHHARRRGLLNRLKTKPCADCQDSFPPWVMQFDHREPAQKSFTISQTANTNLKLLLEETAKCDVVCANCHAERTHKQHVLKALPNLWKYK